MFEKLIAGFNLISKKWAEIGRSFLAEIAKNLPSKDSEDGKSTTQNPLKTEDSEVEKKPTAEHAGSKEEVKDHEAARSSVNYPTRATTQIKFNWVNTSPNADIKCSYIPAAKPTSIKRLNYNK